MHGYRADPPQQRPLTILSKLETAIGLANAVLTNRKGGATRQRQQTKQSIATNGFAKSVPQTNSESLLVQLGKHATPELGLRFSTWLSAERLRGTLFDQLRAVRLQWAHNLRISPEQLNKHYHGFYNTVCLFLTNISWRTPALLHARTTTTDHTTTPFAGLENVA